MSLLCPTSLEYKQVAHHFTCANLPANLSPAGTVYDILTIERIENHEVWAKYALKRSTFIDRVPKAQATPTWCLFPFDDIISSKSHDIDVLRRTKSVKHMQPGLPNERYLFHGSSQVDEILLNGFIVNYAKASESLKYGRGNYFATTASYTRRYAGGCSTTLGSRKVHTRSQWLSSGLDSHETYPYGPNGRIQVFERHVLLTRVLLGETTLAEKGHITAPYLPDSRGMRKYDSTSNRLDNVRVDKTATQHAEIIVFHDDQCLPEYLITFRDRADLTNLNLHINFSVTTHGTQTSKDKAQIEIVVWHCDKTGAFIVQFRVPKPRGKRGKCPRTQKGYEYESSYPDTCDGWEAVRLIMKAFATGKLFVLEASGLIKPCVSESHLNATISSHDTGWHHLLIRDIGALFDGDAHAAQSGAWPPPPRPHAVLELH